MRAQKASATWRDALVRQAHLLRRRLRLDGAIERWLSYQNQLGYIAELKAMGKLHNVREAYRLWGWRARQRRRLLVALGKAPQSATRQLPYLAQKSCGPTELGVSSATP